MSTFGITAVRWNLTHTEIDLCRVHAIASDGHSFVLQGSCEMPFHEVASHIVLGDSVWVMEREANNRYDKRGAVLVKDGQEERLTSTDNSLYSLPTF